VFMQRFKCPCDDGLVIVSPTGTDVKCRSCAEHFSFRYVHDGLVWVYWKASEELLRGTCTLEMASQAEECLMDSSAIRNMQGKVEKALDECRNIAARYRLWSRLTGMWWSRLHGAKMTFHAFRRNYKGNRSLVKSLSLTELLFALAELEIPDRLLGSLASEAKTLRLQARSTGKHQARPVMTLTPLNEAE
jgi:hypothetical protein